jgi:hypothetical protein
VSCFRRPTVRARRTTRRSNRYIRYFEPDAEADAAEPLPHRALGCPWRRHAATTGAAYHALALAIIRAVKARDYMDAVLARLPLAEFTGTYALIAPPRHRRSSRAAVHETAVHDGGRARLA